MKAGPGVWVTKHVVERMQDRGLAPAGHKNLTDLIFYDVTMALKEGRIAKTLPRWAVHGRGRRSKLKGNVRFCWPEDKSRCYVINPHRPKVLRGVEHPQDGRFKQTWTVLTVVGHRLPREAR